MGVERPRVMKSFTQAAGPLQTMVVGTIGPEAAKGYYSLSLNPCGGYLHSLHIETLARLGRIRFGECNGATITQADEHTLKLTTGDPHTIPIAIDDNTGYGGLPDMSAACPYRLDLELLTTGSVTVIAKYWRLPTLTDLLGEPQQQYPPHNGTFAYLNIVHPTYDQRHWDMLMPRTGNLIGYLALVKRNHAADATKFAEVQTPERVIVFHDGMLDPIPTVMASRIAVPVTKSQLKKHAYHWVVRDIFGPAPAW